LGQYSHAEKDMSVLIHDYSSTANTSPVKLLPQVSCPHCWERFPPDQARWISEHVDLLGDPLLGPEQQLRFLPSRFTIDGDALDSKGMVCRSLACPKCHLTIPRAMLEIEPLFVSILGGPASGKSYFLTAMTWQLRKLLPLDFCVAFSDADPAANRALNECEESLFLNPRENEMTPLGSLIRKTELQGELYDSVGFGQQMVSYPRPFLFTMQPREGHVRASAAESLSRILCLYDNAGEHFQPGQDTTASPVTRHLAQSRALLFLFDPTQDKRFRSVCRSKHAGTAGDRDHRLSRQETLLTEAAARVRRLSGLSHHSKYDRPVVIVLSKYDEWSDLFSTEEAGEPWKKSGEVTGIDLELVEQRSERLRRLLSQYCPETVAAAESFATQVTYIAVSSLGNRAQTDPATGLAAIRPGEIDPQWVTVPLLYSLSKILPPLIPRLKRR
jgi:hypothetical protein